MNINRKKATKHKILFSGYFKSIVSKHITKKFVVMGCNTIIYGVCDMKVFRNVIIAIICLLLFNCSSTTKVFTHLDSMIFNKSENLNYELLKIDSRKIKVPRHFLNAVYSYLENELIDNDLIYKGEKNYQVKIEVLKYKMRKGFIKKHFGFLAGGDHILSYITVINKKTGRVIGEAAVDTSNIDKNTTLDDMASMHAKKISRYLTGEDK